MYELEEKFSGMYENPLPSLNPNFRVREHIRRIDIRQTTTIAGRMDIDVVTMDNRTITVQTNGSMTIGDIVNAICKAVS